MTTLELWLGTIVAVVTLHAIPVITVPTWAVLIYLHLNHDMAVVPLALVGAVSAATGRALLALTSRRLGTRVLPSRWRENLDGLAELIRHSRALSATTLGLVGSGAVPSEQVFIAAGIARVTLAPLLAVFVASRFVGYLLWIGTANLAAQSLEETVTSHLGGAAAIAIQVVAFALLVLAMHVDWIALARRLGGHREPPASLH
jgi:hypothetical protein